MQSATTHGHAGIVTNITSELFMLLSDKIRVGSHVRGIKQKEENSRGA